FPIASSVYAYNESLAQEHFPLTRAQAIKRGYLWQDDNEEKKSGYIGAVEDLPDDLHAVDETILKKIFRCEATGRPYKFVKPELAFYQKMKIPLPRFCADYRHMQRLYLRNPRQLWQRSCAACNGRLLTSYAPARPEKLLCE